MSKPETLLKKAIEAGRRREYNEAIALLLKLVADSGEYPQAYLYLGRSYHALGDYNKAVLYLQFFRRERPRSSAGAFFLGRAYLAAGIPAKALPHLEQAAATGKSLKPLILLGLANLRAKNFAAAVEYLGRAVEREPENRRVYIGYLNALMVHGLRRFHAGDLDMARQVLTFLAGLDLESVTVYLYLAKTLRELKEYSEAVGYYRRASELEPGDELIRLQLADTLFAAGKRQEAARLLEELADFLPQGEEFNLGSENVDPLLALKNFQNGRYRQALFHGCQSLKTRRDPDMHLLVAESYRNLDNPERAENHYRQVLKLNSQSPEARMGLAMLDWQKEEYSSMLQRLEGVLADREYGDIARYYSVLGRSRLEYPAQETLDSVIEEIRKSGPDPYILTTLADQYMRTERGDLAEKWYRKALQLKENHTPAREGLLNCIQEKGDTDQLIALYRELLENDESLPVRVTLVEALYGAERYAEAAVEAEELLSRSAPDIRLQRLLAICYRRTKRFRDAAVIYRALLREDPESEVYLRSLLYCLDHSRRRKQAIELLDGAIAYLKKPSSSLYLIRGVLLHKEGSIESAMDAFRSAMEHSPKDWRPYYNIGKIYRKRGMDSFADKFIKKAEELKAN